VTACVQDLDEVVVFTVAAKEDVGQLNVTVDFVDEEIFLRDGRISTSAGISAGIDLMVAIVEQHHGHAIAMSVATGLVLFLRRSGRQAQFSSGLKHQERDAGLFQRKFGITPAEYRARFSLASAGHR
jgi:transcriptional regulator GlxA family with amidase domain